jgi:hypothetical protein
VITLVAKSGYYYPNRIARIYLQSMEEVLGKNGLNALLNLAGLSHHVGNYPPSSLDKEFDFADLSNLNRSVLELYGVRGGGGLSMRVGRATFDRGLKGFGALVGVNDEAFRTLPLSTKLKIGLPTIARIFSTFSDQISRVETNTENYHFAIDRCPVCWGQESDQPLCFFAGGLLQEGLHWLSKGQEYQVEEIECSAVGDDACIFNIDKDPIA